jgi:hypothetical protein
VTWPFPFADAREGRLTRRQWGVLMVAFAALHCLSLAIAVWSGNFDPDPNHDHVHVMRDVLATGLPQRAIWPPGFGYYLAGKSLLMTALGLPYWMGKVLVDVWLVVASGVLSTVLGMQLTRNRILAVASGVGLVAAPIFGLASAEGLAVLLFQPFFLASLVLLVRALQRLPEGRDPGPAALGLTAAAGAVMGLACLVRANPQFLLPVVLVGGEPPVRRRTWTRPLLRALTLLLVFLLAQNLATAPWQIRQRTLGKSGVFTAPVFFYSYIDGLARHPGNPVSDWVRAHRKELPLTFATVVDVNARWLRENPGALLRLYALKAVRTWYLSDSGRWDRIIVGLQAPWWLGATVGFGFWFRRRRRDPALLFVVLVVLYMWGVSALVSGLARYMAPVYGFLGLAAAVPAVEWKRRSTGSPEDSGADRP